MIVHIQAMECEEVRKVEGKAPSHSNACCNYAIF